MSEMNQRIRYLFYLLSKSDGFVRAADLAREAKVTERTVKADMRDVSTYAEKAGAQLISKKGTGYCLAVVDAERFDFIRKQLWLHYSAMGTNLDSVLYRANEILRRIIVEEQYITVDDLAEDFFLTKSSLREEMKLVNQYLSHFHLRWKKKSEPGPLILGDERNRRMLMLCVFENHYHEAVRMYRDEAYSSWFDYDETMRYEIRHIFLKNLRESDCHICDDHTQRFSRYLCLMANRVQAGKCVVFTDEQRKYIRKLRQNQVAHRIVFDLMKYPGFERIPDDEIYMLALLLAEYADISPECNLEVHYADQLKQANDFLDDYEQMVLFEYGIQLNDFSNVRNVLSRALIPLLIQKDFQATEHETRLSSIHDDRISDCPLATQMSYDALFVFERKYGVRLTIDNLLAISTSIHSMLLSIGYDFQPVRALLFPWTGLEMGNRIASMITKRYLGTFEEIKVCELYEMRKYKKEDYDFVILNIQKGSNMEGLAYKYEWPCIAFDTIPNQKQMNELYNRFILNGVQLDEALSHLNLKRISVYQDVEYESQKQFIKLISYKYGKDSASIDVIQKGLQLRSSICAANKCAVLFIKNYLTNESIFDIYQLKQEVEFGRNTISTFIVISFNFDLSLQAARFMNDVIYMIFNDCSMIEKIMMNPVPGTLKEIVRNALKVLPISLN